VYRGGRLGRGPGSVNLQFACNSPAQTGLPSDAGRRIVRLMGLPTGLVTLTPEQVDELNKKLSTLRHDINGDLALVVASAELIKLNPSALARMIATLMDQPRKIKERVDGFSADFEKALGITRP
jgi:hypothetical protein